MDPDILALVLGRRPEPATIRPAWIRGRRRVFVADRPYPMLIPHPGGRVDGHLLDRLGEADLARLSFYEGWEYDLAPVNVDTAPGRTEAAWLYEAAPSVRPDPRLWRLDRWQSLHKGMALARLARLMDAFGPQSGRAGRRPPFTPGA